MGKKIKIPSHDDCVNWRLRALEDEVTSLRVYVLALEDMLENSHEARKICLEMLKDKQEYDNERAKLTKIEYLPKGQNASEENQGSS